MSIVQKVRRKHFYDRAIANLCKQENIKVDNLSVYVHSLIGMCNWIYQWYDPNGKVKPEMLGRYLFEIFFKGFLNNGD